MNDAVTCVIPGGKQAKQIEENVIASDLDPFPCEVMAAVEKIYADDIKPLVHHHW